MATAAHVRTRWGILLTLLWLATSCATAGDSQVATPAFPPLTICGWEGDLPQQVLDGFAEDAGIPATYIPYASTEEAVAGMRGSTPCDVVVMENRYIPALIREGKLARLDHRLLPNFRNLSPAFRDLVYDPSNRYTVPFNWGTTGLVIRNGLSGAPVTRWADLWRPDLAGRVGIWKGQSREVIALTLKALGYSANSERPAELEAALTKLLALRSHALLIDDYDDVTSVPLLADGRLDVAMGYAGDMAIANEQGVELAYVLPQEGALLWGDNFVIPAQSSNIEQATRFLNYLLKPEVGAALMAANGYPIPNDAALLLVDPELRNDPVLFPSAQVLRNAEIILPLSETGEQLYADMWMRFLGKEPQASN